ncbi:3'(2'),5'-bisphosphate nucleotidase CysQ [Alkalilimnicola ehrlichii]|uniref:3'(2'),5'-bisphosphate nucleotidase CysQ n=1 Tax=Alkalilimnicola ehrlichii TaxID=351052 RepID=UPI003B9F08FC
MNNLLTTLHTAMDEAAHRVMAIYADPDRFDTRRKADDSPVTAADLAAHDCLVAHLRAVAPDIPVVSEEARPAPWSERRHWSRCWIIDPLDGTKEFLKRNDEFTINVGLVEGGQPVLGMVDAPALGERYYAIRGEGAWRQSAGAEPRSIRVVEPPRAGDRPWRVVGSRSHASAETQAFIEQLPEVELVPMGSSMKVCLVAEGRADLYARLGPTGEWDTAAAQCVLEEAGGCLLSAETGEPLRYNERDSLINPWFIACARPDPAWQLPHVPLAEAR